MPKRVLIGRQLEDNARRLDERSMGTGGGAVKCGGEGCEIGAVGIVCRRARVPVVRH